MLYSPHHTLTSAATAPGHADTPFCVCDTERQASQEHLKHSPGRGLNGLNPPRGWRELREIAMGRGCVCVGGRNLFKTPQRIASGGRCGFPRLRDGMMRHFMETVQKHIETGDRCKTEAGVANPWRTRTLSLAPCLPAPCTIEERCRAWLPPAGLPAQLMSDFHSRRRPPHVRAAFRLPCAPPAGRLPLGP